MKVSISSLSKLAYYAYHTLIVVLLVCILGVTSGTFAKETQITQQIHHNNGTVKTIFGDSRGSLAGLSVVSMCQTGHSIGELVIPVNEQCALMTNLKMDFSPLSSDQVPFFSTDVIDQAPNDDYKVSSDGKLTITEYLTSTQNAALYISSIQPQGSSYIVIIYLVAEDIGKVNLNRYAVNYANVAYTITNGYSITTQGTSTSYTCNGNMVMPYEPNVTDYPLDNPQSVSYEQNGGDVMSRALTADMFTKVEGVPFLYMAEVTVTFTDQSDQVLTLDPTSIKSTLKSTSVNTLYTGTCVTNGVYDIGYNALQTVYGGEQFYLSFNPLHVASPIHRLSTSLQAGATHFQVFLHKPSIQKIATATQQQVQPSNGFIPTCCDTTILSWFTPNIAIGTQRVPDPKLTAFVFDSGLALINGNFTASTGPDGTVYPQQVGSFVYGFFGKYISNPNRVSLYASTPTSNSMSLLTIQFSGGTQDGIVSAWNARLAPTGLCKVKIDFGNEVIEDDNFLINGDFVLDAQQIAKATTFSSLGAMGLPTTLFPPNFQFPGLFDGAYLSADARRTPVLSSVSRALDSSNPAMTKLGKSSNPIVVALSSMFGFMKLDLGFHKDSMYACSGAVMGTPLTYALFAAGFFFDDLTEVGSPDGN